MRLRDWAPILPASRPARAPRVVSAARRRDRVEALAAEIAAAGREALPATMDVSEKFRFPRPMTARRSHLRDDSYSAIIANAGVAAPGRSDRPSGWRKTSAILKPNVRWLAAYRRVGARRLIAAGSRENGVGRIVLIGSITATITGQDVIISLRQLGCRCHLGRNLAKEWVRLGINVNAMQPGYIQTELANIWFSSEAARRIVGFNVAGCSQ